MSLGAAAAFARGRTERGAVAMRAADEPLDAGADVPADARAESRFSRENLDDVSVRKKREKKSATTTTTTTTTSQKTTSTTTTTSQKTTT